MKKKRIVLRRKQKRNTRVKRMKRMKV